MLLIVCEDKDTLRSLGATDDALVVRDAAEALALTLNGPVEAVLLADRDSDSVASALTSIRSDARMGGVPVYALVQPPDDVAPLLDGVVGDLEEMVAAARRTGALLDEIDPAILAGSKDGRLLGYLYARPGMDLVPIRRWDTARIYSYPVVEAMCGDDQPHVWLKSLRDRSLLAPGRLVDRLRHCPRCDGPHINYVDVCPNCKQLDIQTRTFLHCFTCGNVAPKEAFLVTGSLVCNRCNSRLRRFGADYDRALENYECAGCGTFFVEPEVVASCLHCGQASEPGQLVARPVNTLRLTEQGRLAARHGGLESIYALLDDLHFIRPSQFASFLDWLLGLCRRYPEDAFSLIGLRLENIPELTDRLGNGRVMELIDGFAGRLRETMRTTDKTTRTGEKNFWILLPKTGQAGREAVIQRTRDLAASTLQPEGLGLDIRCHGLTAPDEIMGGEDAELLMARLTGELEAG